MNSQLAPKIQDHFQGSKFEELTAKFSLSNAKVRVHKETCIAKCAVNYFGGNNFWEVKDDFIEGSSVTSLFV